MTPCGGSTVFHKLDKYALGSFTYRRGLKTTKWLERNDPLNDGDVQNVIYVNNENNGLIHWA